jgi:hypothetical protein
VHNGDRILACGCGLVVAAGFVLIEEQHCLAPFLASTAGGKPSGGMRSDDTAEHGKTEISA